MMRMVSMGKRVLRRVGWFQGQPWRKSVAISPDLASTGVSHADFASGVRKCTIVGRPVA